MQESSSVPRLACDAMLGGLARWLRAAGHDTFWQEGIDDGALIHLARVPPMAVPAPARPPMTTCGTASP